jgi:hypothetical protein
MDYQTSITCFLCFMPVLISQCSAELVTAYKFSPENRENEFIVVQPEIPASPPTGFSICLRAMFWTWNERVLFHSSSVTMVIFNYTLNVGAFRIGQNYTYFYTKVMPISSSKWNSICVVYNDTNSFLTITINGV